jgi:dephospho-CoA kinase
VYTVGLTGGIASGKSTVADLFQALGVPVIDADLIARELVEPGRPALAEIAAAFGTDILTARGALDRPRLRELVFADPKRRRRLEAILHPRVRVEMEARRAALVTPYCILSVPLLLESGQHDMVQRILVVDAPRAVQIRRIQARNGLSRAQAEAIIDAQLSRAERLGAADDTILNTGSLDDLKRRVRELHRCYSTLAASRQAPLLPPGCDPAPSRGQ